MSRRETEPRTPSTEDLEFLASYDASRFPRPAVAVDIALLTTEHGSLKALVVRRDEPPYRGDWVLPGGFVHPDESIDDAAERVLSAKAGLDDVFIEQLYTFGAVDRDPRTRVVSVAYYALVEHARLAELHDATRKLAKLDVAWEGTTGGPVAARDENAALPLAFDHADILGLAVERLRGKLDYAPIGFELLPETFTLRDLQAIHETIRGKPVNKDSFRRRMLAGGLIEPTGKRERDTRHRPAELYTFRPSTR